MFRFLNKRATLKKVILIGAFGIMSLGMVIMLTPLGPTSDTSAGRTTLAEIGGTSISTQDVQRLLSEQARRSPYGSDAHMMAQRARPLLDEMVLNSAETMAASKLGVTVSRAEVERTLEANPVLYPGGKFVGDDQAKAILQQQFGITPDQYVERLRQQLLTEKLQHIVTDGVSVTPAEVHTSPSLMKTGSGSTRT